jgi:hypothetical protein
LVPIAGFITAFIQTIKKKPKTIEILKAFKIQKNWFSRAEKQEEK